MMWPMTNICRMLGTFFIQFTPIIVLESTFNHWYRVYVQENQIGSEKRKKKKDASLWWDGGQSLSAPPEGVEGPFRHLHTHHHTTMKYFASIVRK